jgi:hypothetical protein
LNTYQSAKEKYNLAELIGCDGDFESKNTPAIVARVELYVKEE